MSISNLYSREAHQKNLGHFANLVKMSLVDNLISEGEQKLLDRIAVNLNITEEEYEKILKNPDSFPINPPVGYDESIVRLYRLAKMIYADDSPSKKEVSLLKKVAIGLNFPLNNIDKICSEAVHLIMNDNDLEDFTEAIKNVNKQ